MSQNKNKQYRQEIKETNEDISHVLRFADVNGGMYHRQSIYKRKVETLTKLIEAFKALTGDGTIEDEKRNLEIIGYEEQLVIAGVMLKQYNENVAAWEAWMDQRSGEMEQEFDKILFKAKHIGDANPRLKQAIERWGERDDQDQQERLEFYLILKRETLEFEKRTNKKLPEPPKPEPVDQPEPKA